MVLRISMVLLCHSEFPVVVLPSANARDLCDFFQDFGEMHLDSDKILLKEKMVEVLVLD